MKVFIWMKLSWFPVVLVLFATLFPVSFSSFHYLVDLVDFVGFVDFGRLKEL